MHDASQAQGALPLARSGVQPIAPIPGIELFFGLVGPTGTDTKLVCTELAEQLRYAGYEPHTISLSKLIERATKKSPEDDTEYERIRFLMDQGTDLRQTFQCGDLIGRLAVVEIRNVRASLTGDPNTPKQKVAYILTSFKRPEEVALFRDIYGKAFNLVSIYSSGQDRLRALSERLAASANRPLSSVEHQALELINRDASEEGFPLGQDVRDTFPLADFFLALGDRPHLKSQFRRFVHLVFGNPYLTPTKDEYAMFTAQAAALRSGDLSRQVGAAIVSDDGDLLATGCNEVPKAGGGLYSCEDSYPRRDLELGYDTNVRAKKELVEDLLARLSKAGWLGNKVAGLSKQQLFDEAMKHGDGPIADSRLLDVIEFGRAVHAEMVAITDASRRGLSIRGSRLFSTTFPCHICARHIISAGIREVVYVEPYPKSRTEQLYSDSVVVNPKERVEGKVNFVPFEGVAPRRYFDFFQTVGKRKTVQGDVLDWDGGDKEPKVKRFVPSSLSFEQFVVKDLPNFLN